VSTVHLHAKFSIQETIDTTVDVLGFCVRRPYLGDWWSKYENLCKVVVPRSSKLIFEDSENALVSVTMFEKAIDEFKQKARENKCVKSFFLQIRIPPCLFTISQTFSVVFCRLFFSK
jgi:hypothetical protein